MKFVLSIIFLLYVVLVTGKEFKSQKFVSFNNDTTLNPRVTLHPGSFLTKLDHFSPQDNRVARFPYVVNLDFYQPGGPFYIFINDPVTFTDQFLQTGLMFDIARETGAALFTYDHRYYRNSQPTDDLSWESLRYLSFEQSIEDVAHFVDSIKNQLDAPNARVILWGTGNGATRAALARQKYPHLVDAVWASSGRFVAEVSSARPNERLSEIIREIGGDLCADRVQNAFDIIELLLRIGEGEYVQDRMRLCEPVLTYITEDVAFFFESLITFIREYIKRHHHFGLLNMCYDLETTDGDTFSAFIDWVWFAFSNHNEDCLDLAFFTNRFLLREEDWSAPGSVVGRRQLFYQQCTQLGLFTTTVNGDTLFGRTIALDYHVETCNLLFEGQPGYDFDQLDDQIDALLYKYGGKNPGIDHAIFTNGLMDTLLDYAITEYDQPESYVINIPWYADSADVFSPAPTDGQDLANAKELIRQTIIRWSSQ